MILKRADSKNFPQAQEVASASLSPLLEPLVAVHSASDMPWLTEAAMTAAERGVGALYGFLYLGEGPPVAWTARSRPHGSAQARWCA